MCARVTYGALVTEIKGSVGGSTFQSNRFGFTMKNKPSLVDRMTQLQLAKRQRFAYLANAWQSITPALRADYESYAASFPQYAKNGGSAALTGFNLFVKWNMLAFIDTYQYNEIIVQSDVSFAAIEPSIVVDGPLTMMHLNPSFSQTNGECNIAISPAVSVSRNYCSVITRTNGIFDLESGTGDIKAWFLANYGYNLAVGQTVFVKAVRYGMYSPKFCSEQFFRCTVTST